MREHVYTFIRVCGCVNDWIWGREWVSRIMYSGVCVYGWLHKYDSCICHVPHAGRSAMGVLCMTWRILMWHDLLICDMPHSYVTSIRVMTHSYVTCLGHMWYDSCIFDITHLHVAWLILMLRDSSRLRCDCRGNDKCMSHVTYERGLKSVNEACHVWMSHMSESCHTWVIRESNVHFMLVHIHAWIDSFIYDMTHSDAA